LITFSFIVAVQYQPQLNNFQQPQHQQAGYPVMPSVYQQSCAPQQYMQRVSYPQNNITKAGNYQQRPINGCQSVYPITNSQQTFSVNRNMATVNQPINGREKNVNNACDCITVKPLDFRCVKRPVENPHRNPDCKLCQEEAETNQLSKMKESTDDGQQSVEITKFIAGSGSFKREPDSLPDPECNEKPGNKENELNTGEDGNDDSGMGSPPHLLGESSICNNNENMDPNSLQNEEFVNNDSIEIPEELNCTMEDREFAVLEISSEAGTSNAEIRNKNFVCNTNYDSSCVPNGCTSTGYNSSKLSIEAVTSRLALRERSKIFRRSEKKWHVAVNETAFQLVLKDPKLLLRKKDLRLMAESEVRKTYIFAKGNEKCKQLILFC